MSNDTEVQHTYDKPQKENSALTALSGLKRAVRAAFHYSYLWSVWCIT